MALFLLQKRSVNQDFEFPFFEIYLKKQTLNLIITYSYKNEIYLIYGAMLFLSLDFG